MYVYILQSLKDPSRKYIGATKDIKTRLSKHNKGDVAHSSKFRPWKFSIAIWFGEDKKAWSFEKYLKTGSGWAFINRHF